MMLPRAGERNRMQMSNCLACQPTQPSNRETGSSWV